MRDTCVDIVSSQSIIIPRLRIIGDGTMLHPHTLTHETSCRCLRFGAEMKIASILLSFSRRLWSDVHSLASSCNATYCIGSFSIPHSTQVNIQLAVVCIKIVLKLMLSEDSTQWQRAVGEEDWAQHRSLWDADSISVLCEL